MDSSGGGAGATVPYLGSKISLISSIDIRYEGTLYSINAAEATVALKDVRSFGTEGRRQPDLPPSNKTYQFIIFKGSDIQDLTVSEPAPPPQIRNDPAVVSVNVPPARVGGGMQGPMGGGRNSGGGDWMGGEDMGGGWGSHGGRMQHGRGGHHGGAMMRPPPHFGGYGGFGGRGRGPHAGDMYAGAAVRGDGQYPARGGRGGHPGGGRGGVQRGGGGGGRGAGGGGVRRVVGELPPQPNQQVKKDMATAFDFETSNARLNKADIKSELDQLPVAPAAAGTTSSPAANEGGENEAAATNDGVTTATTATKGVPQAGYDKKTSFFDRISCETLDRKAGHDTRVDREKQRALDQETFGAAASAPRGRNYRRSYGRGGNRRGGGRGGGGFGGYGSGGGRFMSAFNGPPGVMQGRGY